MASLPVPGNEEFLWAEQEKNLCKVYCSQHTGFLSDHDLICLVFSYFFFTILMNDKRWKFF
jgi:hypothetical protein